MCFGFQHALIFLNPFLISVFLGKSDIVSFMGVGSEVYGAVRAGRRGVGCELKPSYFKQAVHNLAGIKFDNPESMQPELF